MRYRKTAPVSASLWLPGLDPNEPPTTRSTPAVADIAAAVVTPDPPQTASLSLPLFDSEIVVKPVATAPAPKAIWPRLASDAHEGLGGDVKKFDANLAALRVLKLLEQERRVPHAAERRLLNRYTGWGGLPQAFNLEKDNPWHARAKRLRDVLGTNYENARASVVNAHYTELYVVEALWAAVQRFGFKGGRVLDPSAGTGFFLGAMPSELAAACEITAVEIEPVSARILSALYASFGVKTHTSGFEKAPLPQDWYDLAISNIPFGDYPVCDDRHVPFARFLIHDYFFARGLEVVRPGGLIAFMTSAGTLDKADRHARHYIASKARFLGAIRLPRGTLSYLANTEVTVDIVFLQKLGKLETASSTWTALKKAPRSMCEHGYEELSVSSWYVDHPEMLIGRMGRRSNGHAPANAAIFSGDTRSELAARIERLPQDIYTPPAVEIDKPTPREIRVASPSYIKPGAYCLTEERLLAVSEGDELLVIEEQVSPKLAQRLRGMISIRDAARELLNAQYQTSNDDDLRVYQRCLNGAYDRFVMKHGYLHTPVNRQAFRGDPDLPLLLSLEQYDPESHKATKADVFFRRTVSVVPKIEHCDTPEEALVACLHERGRVDVEFMAVLLGQEPSLFVPSMAESGVIFRNPEDGEWETADAYLSGNIRLKLRQAEAAGEEYARNLTALQAVIPADLGPGDIDARIGSTWIASRDYAAFLDFILGCKGCTAEFSAKAGAWNVETPYCVDAVASGQTFGTERMSAATLFGLTLNQLVPTIRDYDAQLERYVVNKAETLTIREKQHLLKEAFRDWIFTDTERCARLVRTYNDEFNSTRLRSFDGLLLKLPGFSQVYELYRHQKDGIWRIVSSGFNTLLAHVVGAGKTLTMICAGMEMRRLGMVNKPCYVVPNLALEQFTEEFLRAYPHANILMAGKEDLVGDKRRTLLAKVATGDWDAVLITHASFERIQMSDAAMRAFINAELREICDAIRATSKKRGNRIVKQLERAKKVWEARLERFSAPQKKDTVVSFEELGIDFLFVDEAHYFKNLYRLTKMRVAGLPNRNSQRAFDMLVKTRHVMDLHAGRWGVVFATGTPVSNTIAELWTMQRFLQPLTLKERLMEHFDPWAANFGESVTALETAPDGSGYRMHTRFARFVNLLELRTMFGEVADIRTAQMLKLPVPKSHLETVVAKPTPELKALVKTLVARAEDIRNGKVSPRDDNMLAVTNDGRKAALEMRLIDPLAQEAPGGKVNLCAQQVFQIWQRTAAFRGTQVVFCDLSTPSRDGRFSVYDELRAKLIEKGIPAEEIAFVHDYEDDVAKAVFFKDVREGRFRVPIGSTQKAGVAANYQTRLIALHHLDGPWRPADVEQREGRIVRQGNINEEVWIFRYVTEGSFDAYIWQTLEGKARFIAQFLSGSGPRSAEDVELAALTFAEVKALATGNPLIIEKAGIDAEVTRLSVLKSQWDNQQWKNRGEVAVLPDRIDSNRRWVAEIESDLQRRVDVRGDRFALELGGTTYRERVPAGEALLQYYHRALDFGRSLGINAKSTEWRVGRFAGFPLLLSASPYRPPIFVLEGRYRYDANHSESALGLVQVLEHAAESVDKRIASANVALAREEKLLADLQALMGRPFEKAERLTELLGRQREINAALDLDKNAADAMDAEVETEEVDAEEVA